MTRDERLAVSEAAAIGAMRDPTAYSMGHQRMVQAAVEVATQVRVTDEHVQAVRPGTTPGSVVWTRTRGRIVRAFEAAGFEVEL